MIAREVGDTYLEEWLSCQWDSWEAGKRHQCQVLQTLHMMVVICTLLAFIAAVWILDALTMSFDSWVDTQQRWRWWWW